jgi:hypothetical protein
MVPPLSVHVFWGSLLGAGLTFLLLLVLRSWALLLVFAIFVGIAVDVWAHGYEH